MNPLARFLGIAGVAVTLFLFVSDFLAHAEGGSGEGADAPPPGFRHFLEGIGVVEVAFDGRVDLVADEPVEEDGAEAVRRVPRYHITGDDPRPEDGGMRLSNALIRTAGGRRVGFAVRAPSAWIALDRDQPGLSFDLDTRWRLDAPVIEIQDLFPGQVVTVVTDGAEVLPATDQVWGRGPFTLSAGDMRVTGADLALDLRTQRVDFAPHQGALAWDVGGERASGFSGEADAPGWIEPRPGGGYHLHVDAEERVLMRLPVASRMTGALRCMGLDVDLNAGADGVWRAERALGAPPTRWIGREQSLRGGRATVLWHADGDVDGMDLLGPVQLFRSTGALDWATARGGAWIDPRAPAVHLYGGVLAHVPRGVLRSARALLRDGEVEAGGGVLYAGEGGTARADSLHRAPDGSGVATGDVRLFPADPRIARVTSPRFFLDADGGIRTDAGFRVKARGEDGEPLYGEGLRFETRLVRGSRRSRAEEELTVRQGGLVMHGDLLEQTGDKRLELTGDPVRGELALDEGVALLTNGRTQWTGSSLYLREDPVLRVPAAALGLAGEEARLATPMAARAGDGQVWTMERGVTLSGALEGSADRAEWAPGRHLHMESERGIADLRGTRADGGRFHAEARRLILDLQARTLDLERRGYLAWRAAGREAPLELWGERAQLGENAGWAEGESRFRTADGRGSADRITWEHAGEAGWDVHLLGSAGLTQGEARATGDALHYDAASGELLAIGTGDAPAQVTLESGGEWTAAWIRYNVVTRLVASGDVVAEAPAPRE